MLGPNNILSEREIDAIYSNIYANLMHASNGEIVLCHFGSIDFDFVYGLSEDLELMMIKKGVEPTLIKRIIAVVMEGLQNVCFYGAQHSDGEHFGHLMINQNGEEYKISIGNIIEKENKQKLAKFIDKLNTSSSSELNDLYLNSLTESLFLKNIYSNLGLIIISMKSTSKIDFNFSPFNSKRLYFEMKVSIS